MIAEGDIRRAAGILGRSRLDRRPCDEADATAWRGRGTDTTGHPLEALAWLANTLAGRGRSLEQGDLVLTGSMVLVQWIDGATDVEVTVAGPGGVRVRFDEG